MFPARATPPESHAKTAVGAATNVPGLDEPYEPPHLPAVTIDTERQSVVAGVTALLAALTSAGYRERQRWLTALIT